MEEDGTEGEQPFGQQDGEELFRAIYQELRSIAHAQMRNQRKDHTLDATALVHEAYFRLSRSKIKWNSRDHFLAVAAKAMRHILVDHARKRRQAKEKNGGGSDVLDSVVVNYQERALDLIALDDALKRLARQDERAAQLVELYFFAGQEIGDCARILGSTDRTMYRTLQLAKAWLHSNLDEG